MKKSTVLFLMGICGFVATNVWAQLGGLRGVVMDQDFKVPLSGVKVCVSETGKEAVTSDTGSYYFENIKPDSYTLIFSKDGYTRITKSEVVVVPGALADVEVSMAGEYEDMDELVVRDIQLGGASEIGLLNLRMESSALMNSVGADLMGKAGASDAAQALLLVPGTTIQDGKYAVVRGLPDRYVSTQMNGVRLPTADPDKRAVQLDQFPAAMIESMQVSKTFTPDQQGDASGGAVNVVLKGVPDEPVLKVSVGTECNTQVLKAGNQFLGSTDGGVGGWGNRASSIHPQPEGTSWVGAVGVSRRHAPLCYNLGITAGDKIEFDSGLKIGAMGSFFYKRKASYYEGGIDDQYWQKNPGDPLTPQYSGNDNLQGNMFNTALFDVTKASEEVQWGALAALGVETENHALSVLYSHTFSGENSAILLENTRGKYYYFPGHNPYNQNSPGHYNDPNGEDNTEGSRFRRNETLEYVERISNTLQVRGKHTFLLPDWSVGSFFHLLDPKLDWTIATSSSSLNSPDKRMFESFWVPPYLKHNNPNNPRGNVHEQINDGSTGGLGNMFRIWKKVDEKSDQFFANSTFPFEQWSEKEGYLKCGFFADHVRREYRQESFSSDPTLGGSSYQGDWSDFWSAHYPNEGHVMNAADIDVNYDGEQKITAFYGMVDVPVTSFLTFLGGARFEKTELSTQITEADGGNLLLFLPPTYNGIDFNANKELANAHISQADVLPSLGFECTPLEKWVLRGTYSETIARMTFKELTPIQQQDYVGGDIFIGNPELQMSALKNYDLRLDYNPYPGGLFSFSWFYKEIKNPIEYRQVLLGGSTLATTAENYPKGTLQGYEAEVRQSLGRFWDPLEGLSLSANVTLIHSDVQLPETERQELANLGVSRRSRAMLNAPEYLYNLNATYSIPHFGTELGLFYTVKGDTLVAGGGNVDGNFAPDIYATQRGTLNFTLSQKLTRRMKLRFKIKNLTNSSIQEVYRSKYISGDMVRRSYKVGVNFTVGISTTW